MNTKNSTHKIVITSMLSALTCVATMIIKIPSPLEGYLNIGDCIVLLAGWLLSPAFAFLSAGIGSALADVFSGYVIYAPATFIIKGLMAIIAHFLFKILKKKTKNIFAQIISGAIAEVWMILGYFVFEGFLYGFAPSLVNIPANGVQGLVGLVLGVVVIKIFERSKINF